MSPSTSLFTLTFAHAMNYSGNHVGACVDFCSFGIVMWEIYSRGEPYSPVTSPDDTMAAIIDGLRPDVPPSMPLLYRALMERCWHTEPTERKTFVKICNSLETMTSEMAAMLCDTPGS